MDIFNKLVKKSQKSDREAELEIELDNLKQKYDAIKQSHDYTVKMMEDSKKSDNNLLLAYNRLREQFNELAKLLAIKKNIDYDKILIQQEEVCRRRDELHARERKVIEEEKEIQMKKYVIELVEGGKSVVDIVLENRRLAAEVERYKERIQQKDQENLNLSKTNQALQDKIAKNKQKYKTLQQNLLKSRQSLENLRNSCKLMKNLPSKLLLSLASLKSETLQLNDFNCLLESSSALILKQLSSKPSPAPAPAVHPVPQRPQEECKKLEEPSRPEEAKKLESVIRKAVIPQKLFKKHSTPKIEDLDLEKELGNPFN